MNCVNPKLGLTQAGMIVLLAVYFTSNALAARPSLSWLKHLPTSALVMARRSMPCLDVDAELNSRMITKSRNIVWCDESALAEWQWHLLAATPSSAESYPTRAVCTISEYASAICQRRATAIQAGSPLLTSGVITIAELQMMQRELGVVSVWVATGARRVAQAPPDWVTIETTPVDLVGDGRRGDIVLILSMPRSWTRQVWVLSREQGALELGGAATSPRAGSQLIRTLTLLGASGLPRVLDLGSGRVCLCFSADACRGTGVCYRGEVFCNLPPRSPADTWMIPNYGYCEMPGPSGRWYRLADVEWSIESDARGATFAADLKYTIGSKSEPEENAWDYSLRVVLARPHDEGALHIRRDASGVLVPGNPETFVPGLGVPAEIEDLWAPLFYDPKTLNAEIERSVPAHACGVVESRGGNR